MWKKSSPIQTSIMGACGEMALTAGCGSMPAIMARKPRIAGADKARAAVVAGHVLQQPGDGVVGVGAFVDGLGIVVIGERAHHDEFALALVAAANVLGHDRCSRRAPVRGGCTKKEARLVPSTP